MSILSSHLSTLSPISQISGLKARYLLTDRGENKYYNFGDFMKSIEINYLTSSGYETLYPQTNSDLVTYNSQTLTQVINQQNSEIEGLQGQVGDSEVGVTIPKVMEYHFGEAQFNSSVNIPIFNESTSFPLGSYYVLFIFENFTVDQNFKSFHLKGAVSQANLNLLMQSLGYPVTMSPFKIGFFIKKSPAIGNNSGSFYWWNGDSDRATEIVDVDCNYNGGNCYFYENWNLMVTGSAVVFYSSLNIRFYYYD